MPPTPVIADVFRVALQYSFTGGASAWIAYNVMHIKGDGNTAEDAIAALNDAQNASMWGAQSTVVHPAFWHVTPLDGESATIVAAVDPARSGGTDSQPIPQVANIVKIQSALRGRSNNGRVFLPGVGEAVDDSGFLDTGVRSTVEAAWQTFADDLADPGGFAFGVASYKNAEFHEAVSITAERPLATQRRRQSRLR